MNFTGINPRLEQLRTTYHRYRSWLIFIFIFSVINVISLVVSGVYFLFSSYFALELAATGYLVSAELGTNIYLIVFAAIAILSVIPYLLCYIFSGRRVGWTVAGFVLFICDTVFLCYSAFSTDPSYFLTDIIFHVICVAMLGIAIVKGRELKALEMEEAEKLSAAREDAQSEGENEGEADAESAFTGFTRTVTVTRVKKLAAAMTPITCFIDGVPVAAFKNGETHSLTVNGTEHKMIFVALNGTSPEVIIPEGADNIAYNLTCKVGMVDLKLIVERA